MMKSYVSDVPITKIARTVGKGRKHFPNERNFATHNEPIRVRCRTHIPHGYCVKDDLSWKPHQMALCPEYTNYGLDWSSSKRQLPAYQAESRKDELIWPDKCSHLRTFAGSAKHGLAAEWDWYPNGYSNGKKCLFDGIHRRSQYCGMEYKVSLDEITKRSDIVENGGLSLGYPGNKPYKKVEYSPEFYKLDSTVPKTQFGRITHLPKPIAIPWFPVGRQITYATVRQLENEARVKKEVSDLSYWSPSPSFLDTVYAIDFSRKRTRMSRVRPVPEDLELPYQQKPTL